MCYNPPQGTPAIQGCRRQRPHQNESTSATLSYVAHLCPVTAATGARSTHYRGVTHSSAAQDLSRTTATGAAVDTTAEGYTHSACSPVGNARCCGAPPCARNRSKTIPLTRHGPLLPPTSPRLPALAALPLRALSSTLAPPSSPLPSVPCPQAPHLHPHPHPANPLPNCCPPRAPPSPPFNPSHYTFLLHTHLLSSHKPERFTHSLLR